MRYWKLIVSVILTIIYLCLFISNAVCNKEFFKIPLYNLLNIAIAIIFAYYFVQKRNDERKLKEIIEDVIEKIQLGVDCDIDDIDITKREDILQSFRKVNNKMNILTNIEDKLNIAPEVEYIKRNFLEFRQIITDNIENKDFFHEDENKMNLKRLQNLIIDKSDELKIMLYHKKENYKKEKLLKGKRKKSKVLR